METASLIDALKVFCDSDASRYCLAEPWSADGRIYATDGRIAAWAQSDIEVPQTIEGRRPKMQSVIDLDSPTGEPFPGPPSCSKCDGSGVITTTVCDYCDGRMVCSECCGSGTEECHSCGHEHDCEECEGSGECSECSGTGQVKPFADRCKCISEIVTVLGRKLRGEVAWRIATLPNVRCGISKADPDKLVFESDCGIRGVTVFERS